MIKIRQLFAKKSPPVEERKSAAPSKLHMSALDGCVGGQMETDGVGCYLRSTQPPSH